ncbi:hypothetical protein AAC387_Pa10g1023 [Persea americana]
MDDQMDDQTDDQMDDQTDDQMDDQIENITGGDGRETERLGDLLVQFYLTDFKWRVIRCNGFEGVGRWRIAEEAAKIAKLINFRIILS